MRMYKCDSYEDMIDHADCFVERIMKAIGE